MKTVAILQSCYIPWKGYFDIIRQVDEFIFYDDIFYSKNNWRNRNKIKTKQGLQWLSIPVHHNINTLICDVTISDKRWAKKHWKSIQTNYSHSVYFKQYQDIFSDVYQQAEHLDHLSHVNYLLIKSICQLLAIKTPLRYSTDYPHTGNKTEKLIQICKVAGATDYLSGPAAQNYIEVEKFKGSGINVNYINYDNYQPYPQRHGEFIHQVSIIDLIFNTGPEAIFYLHKLKHGDGSISHNDGKFI